MRILWTSDFLNPDNIGGAGRVILETAHRLAARGHQIAILAGNGRARRQRHGDPHGDLDWFSFPYATHKGRGAIFFCTSQRAARRAFSQANYHADLIIHNQPLTAHALHRVATPYLYIFHSPWPMEYLADRFAESDPRHMLQHGWHANLQCRVRRHIEHRVLRRAGAVMTLSETMKNMCMQLYDLPENRLHVCPGGVDTEKFTGVDPRRRHRLRRELAIMERDLLLVCVRRLILRTGIDLLLHAVASVPQTGRRIHCWIAGGGPLHPELQDLSKRLGLHRTVKFLGYVPDAQLKELYQAADLAVMPSRALEGFGLSTLEAMACGTPVMATPIGGSVEILQSLDPKLLTTTATADAIADTLTYWRTHDGHLHAVRRKCREHVVQHYSWDSFAGHIEDLAASGRVLRTCPD